MTKAVRIAALVSMLFAATPGVFGQVTPGTYPYGTFDKKGFDTINVGNLNVHFSIPVFNKAGRGAASFSYALTNDNSVWFPSSVNGQLVWTPTANFGWGIDTQAFAGFISYNFVEREILCSAGTEVPAMQGIWSDVTYHDSLGGSHLFGGLIFKQVCENGFTSTTDELNKIAEDNSGYQILNDSFIINQSSSGSVTNRNGVANTVPVNTSSGTATYQDTNGNQIAINGSGQITDTTGNVVLTIGGNPSTTETFSYPNPQGGTSTVTMNRASYTVATNFQAGIGEFGPTAEPLVSSISLPDGSRYSFTYEPTPGSCTVLAGTNPSGCVTGRINSVTLPTGGTISYSYTGGSNGIESDGSTAGLNRIDNTGAVWSYSRGNFSEASGPGSTWTTTVVSPASNTYVASFSEDSSTTDSTTNNPYLTQEQIFQGANSPGNLLQTTIQCYNGNYSNCAGAAISTPLTQIDAYTQLPNGLTRLSEIDYNNYGLETGDLEYDYGITMGAAPTIAPVSNTQIAYYGVTSNGIASERQTVSVRNSSGTNVSSTTYTYDGVATTPTSGTPSHVAVSGSNGNLTQVVSQTGSTALTANYTYYDTGMPNTATGVNGAVTTYVYGSGSCGNSFVTSVNEPTSAANTVKMSQSAVWNCVGGVQTQATDENGNSVTATYSDPNYWRETQVTDQENNATTISYNVGGTVMETSLSGFNGGNSAYDFRTTMDAYGRPAYSQQLQAPGAGTYDTAEMDYNSVGQMSRVTMPYSASGSSSSPNTSAPGTGTTYDALGRRLTVTAADGGTTTYQYTNNDVLITVSGSQSFKKQLEYDGLGRLTSVCEISSSLPGVGPCGQGVAQTGYLTKYTYDALGHRLSVTQNAQASSGQQGRSFTYDMLGRMTSETNPESGTTQYFWDIEPSGCNAQIFSRSGTLAAIETNDGVFVCYAYDALYRMIGYFNSVDTNCGGFIYDAVTSPPAGVSASNVAGRIVRAYTNSACNGVNSLVTDEWFGYSPRGELTDVYESTPNSGGYYHSNAFFYPTGAVATLSIPGVPTVNYGGLDGEGRYTTITASYGVSMVASASYSTSSSTNALGALTGITFGSGNTQSFATDPNTGRETGYSVNIGGATDTGTLTWNSNGTLGNLTIADNVPGTSDSENCGYGYDDLKRISSVNCGTLWGQTFNYDAFGNISKNVPSGSSGLTFNPTYGGNNQFSSLPGVTVQYDADGKLLADNLNSYTWDHYGRLATASNGSTAVTAVYDAFGRLVQNSADGEFIWTPVGQSFAAIAGGQTLRQALVPLLGGATAVWGSAGLSFYRFADHLGSARIDATSTGTFFSAVGFGPFGEQYAKSGAGDGPFTGYGQNTLVDGLYDFPFRKLSTSQGRWISPDPAGVAAVNPRNPQSWNRYSYVLNNPMALVDPTGEECVWDDGSYDAADDPNTGTSDLCEIAGGNFVPPEVFEGAENNSYGSWNAQASQSIAFDWLTPAAIVNADIGDIWTESSPGYPPGVGVGGGAPNNPCPALPNHPDWASPSIDINSLQGGWNNIDSIQLLNFKRMVQTGGPMDYKQWGDYVDFGNFNFGYVGAGLGIPDELLRWGAGYANWHDNPQNRPIYGSPFDPNNPTHGDQPGDQAQINAGIAAYKAGCHY